MGREIAAALEDRAVIEIMVNPDGALRVDRLGVGRCETGITLAPEQAERIIRLVASHARTEVHAGAPIVSAELPPLGNSLAGERFEGLLPPVSTGPCFAIRKPAERIYRLSDYVADGVMTDSIAALLAASVVERLNILVAGATSSGSPSVTTRSSGSTASNANSNGSTGALAAPSQAPSQSTSSSSGGAVTSGGS